jgi:hypothetical protein
VVLFIRFIRYPLQDLAPPSHCTGHVSYCDDLCMGDLPSS